MNKITKTLLNAKRVFDDMFDADKIYEEYAKHIERIVSGYRKLT